jgi:predicted secreted protein
MAEIVLTKDDTDRPIMARRGDRLIASLAEFPSTGLSWSPEVSAPTVVALESDDYTRSEPMIPGGGGSRRFVFRAASAGEAKVSFTLAYQVTNKVVQTLAFQIRVA